MGFPGRSDGKESACNLGDLGSIPGLGRSLGGGHGNHSSILTWEIPMDRGALWAIVHGGCKELDLTWHSTAHATKSIFSDINMATPAFLSQIQ